MLSDRQAKTAALLTEVIHALKQGLETNLVAVVLFGSQARGEAGEASDWDLFVVAQNLPQKPWQRHLFLKRLLPEDWRGRVAILARTPAEFESRLVALYLDIAQDGIVLYDSGHYITARLSYLRRLIAQHGLRRDILGKEMIWRWTRPPTSDWALTWEIGQ